MRSEEEMSLDILIYEKKYNARQRLAVFEKKQKRCRIICAAASVVSFAVAAKFMLWAYDSERVALLCAVFAAWVLFCAAVYAVAGSVSCRSVRRFFLWSSLASSFKSAEQFMHKTEERFAEGTVYGDDVRKAEEKLVSLSDRINSLGSCDGKAGER